VEKLFWRIVLGGLSTQGCDTLTLALRAQSVGQGGKKEDVIFLVKMYSNITIALASVSRNKELSRSLDGLHVVSY
jgi:hypothetical protein